MTWIKFDDRAPSHPKIVGLSDAAFRCWVQGLCYASEHVTDGRLPKAALRLLGTARAARELLEAGLWVELPDGWEIHDYADWQRTSDEIETQRSTKSRAGGRGNHERWHAATGTTSPDCRYCDAEGSQVRSQTDRTTSQSSEVDTETEPSGGEHAPPDLVELSVVPAGRNLHDVATDAELEDLARRGRGRNGASSELSQRLVAGYVADYRVDHGGADPAEIDKACAGRYGLAAVVDDGRPLELVQRALGVIAAENKRPASALRGVIDDLLTAEAVAP